MKNHKFNWLYLALFFLACNQGPEVKTGIPSKFEEALPHAQVDDSTQLNEADRRKLGEAKGKTSAAISPEDLNDVIEKTEGLTIINFWTIDNEQSRSQALLMAQFEKDLDEGASVIFVNTDDQNRQVQANAFIRENNIISETYLMDEMSKTQFFKQIDLSSQADKIGLVLLKKSEEVKVFLEEIFDIQELNAVLAPYMM